MCLYRFFFGRRPVLRLFYSSLLFVCLCLLWRSLPVYGQSCALYPSAPQRIGYNVTLDGGVSIADYDAARLGAGWYHDYNLQLTPLRPGGLRYYQVVRGKQSAAFPALRKRLAPVIDANPSTLWLLGNEPDRYGQDELSPAAYATFYHEFYTFIK